MAAILLQCLSIIKVSLSRAIIESLEIYDEEKRDDDEDLGDEACTGWSETGDSSVSGRMLHSNMHGYVRNKSC